MKSIEILVMVVLGGMGSMLGSILSATVLTILPEATRSFESYRMVVYSLVLVLMMIIRLKLSTAVRPPKSIPSSRTSRMGFLSLSRSVKKPP